MSTKIDQKKYLKKYLSKPDKKKKQKKKLQVSDGIKIIDDDIGLSELPFDEAEIDLFASAEDAPQVVAVIDERPIEMRIKEKFELRNRWQEVSDEGIKNEDDEQYDQKVSTDKEKTNCDQFIVRKSSDYKNICSKNVNAEVESDSSPPRQRNRKLSNHSSNESDMSPVRKYNRSNSLEKKDSFSNYKKRKLEDNESLPKEKIYKNKHSYRDTSTERHSASPLRKNKYFKNKDVDYIPDQKLNLKLNYDSDSNSLRKKSNFQYTESLSNYDSDASPPRRKNHFQNSEKQKSNYDSDTSPPRKKNYSESMSQWKNKNNNDMSPPRKYKCNLSPGHQYFTKQNKNDLIKKSGSKRSHNDKLKKTLDGKVAGLQNSHNLKNELIEIKKKENDVFSKLSFDLTGVNATPIVRDRKTGRIRDLEKEIAQQKLKEEKDNVQKEKYSRWGKGLKQVDDINEKIQNDLYEMSKPLARYADDTDLENYLRSQEREGDPMLEYIRKEKKDKYDISSSKKPQYKGSFMPNRFNISPGYRWDGVDRSNGYEKKWFETINAKKAREELAYKWSTEDM